MHPFTRNRVLAACWGAFLSGPVGFMSAIIYVAGLPSPRGDSELQWLCPWLLLTALVHTTVWLGILIGMHWSCDADEGVSNDTPPPVYDCGGCCHWPEHAPPMHPFRLGVYVVCASYAFSVTSLVWMLSASAFRRLPQEARQKDWLYPATGILCVGVFLFGTFFHATCNLVSCTREICSGRVRTRKSDGETYGPIGVDVTPLE